MLFRRYVISAIFRRNVASYFSGVLGYLFIIAFVVAGGLLAFRTQFFTNNVANLDQLSEDFPRLLLFLIPAITMSAWADEKKLGTDELLFTLPATDLEILIGKYLAVVAVYSIALAFSLTHLIVLSVIGSPDLGVAFTTYFGYWLAGSALLAAGMFGSVLTSSTTVAFVLGVIMFAVPVFIGSIAPSNDFLRNLSVREQLHDFELGMIPLSGILYFVSLTVFMLYLNLVMVRRRHWSTGQRTSMEFQYVVRAICLCLALICVDYIASHAERTGRLDARAGLQLVGDDDRRHQEDQSGASGEDRGLCLDRRPARIRPRPKTADGPLAAVCTDRRRGDRRAFHRR